MDCLEYFDHAAKRLLGTSESLRNPSYLEQFPAFGDEVFVQNSDQNKIVRRTTQLFVRRFAVKLGVNVLLGQHWLLTKSVMAIIKRYSIDVVVFANLLPPYLVSGRISKDILSVVDLVDHYPTIAAQNTPTFIPKRLLDLTFSYMMKSVISDSDATVACSYKLGEYANTMGANQMFRVPNGVEESFFSNYQKDAIEIRQKLGIASNDLAICFVGNLEYWLSMGDFIDALYMVKKKSKKRFKFLIAGGKLSTDYVNTVDLKIRQLGLGENVIRLGFVPHVDVPKYVAAADICVSPKSTKDPVSYYSSPVKVWEYLAQEKPVISTPIPEILLSANDCVSLANSREEYFNHLMAFMEDPEPFRERAKKGKAMVERYT